MSCNCNTQKNKGLCSILDLDVTYTGNSMEVNGVFIRSGENLRVVLDAILKGDQDGPTEEITNFWFGMLAPTADTTANLNDFYLQGNGEIWQYTQPVPTVAASWVDTGVNIGGEAPEPPEWGEITGDINAQTDLLEFIQENALSPESIGSNLHLTEAGVLNAGIDMSTVLPGVTVLAFSESGNGFPFGAQEAGVIIYQGTISAEVLTSFSVGGKGGAAIATFATNQVQFAQNVLVNADITVDGVSTFNDLASVNQWLQINLAGQKLSGPALVVGGLTASHVRLSFLQADQNAIVVGKSGGGAGAHIAYANGMPAAPTANMLVTKGYVDTLQTQIDDLEARVAALETP